MTESQTLLFESSVRQILRVQYPHSFINCTWNKVWQFFGFEFSSESDADHFKTSMEAKDPLLHLRKRVYHAGLVVIEDYKMSRL